MIFAWFALVSFWGCAEPPRQTVDGALVPHEGVVELLVDEPVFATDIEIMVAQGVAPELARERARGYALLSWAARRSGTISVREREQLRRRAAVQLYLRDVRDSTDAPSEAALRGRYEESSETRPFDEVADELRETIEIERTFARIFERVMIATEDLSPTTMPDALPPVERLRFSDGAR